MKLSKIMNDIAESRDWKHDPVNRELDLLMVFGVAVAAVCIWVTVGGTNKNVAPPSQIERSNKAPNGTAPTFHNPSRE